MKREQNGARDADTWLPRSDTHGVDERDWLLATMCFPNDEHLRRGFAVVQAAGRLLNEAPTASAAQEKGAELVLISRALLDKLIGAPAHAQIKQAQIESVKRGTVAGDCLATMYVTAKFPQELGEPSLRKALHVGRCFAKQSAYGDNSPMSTRPETIRDYWGEFKPVAHLWAAFRLLRAFSGKVEFKQIFKTPEGLREVYGVARSLANFGCQYIPRRARPAVPLLDSSRIFKVPDEVQSIDLLLKRPPEQLVEALRSYKAPLSRDSKPRN